MKKYYISALSLLVAVVGFGVWYNASNDTVYSPRTQSNELVQGIQGYAEYMNSLRQNPSTGTVSPEDIESVTAEINALSKLNKADFPLTWEFAGPDNIGGRTRAIVVDKDDTKLLYAAGVAGGVFKSTNGGASWYPADDANDNLNSSSLCQTINGDLYYGTGERYVGGSGGGNENGSPGFIGNGIYRSTDQGETFEHLPTSSLFRYVNKLVAHPSKNMVFAATSVGLRYSEDDGKTWVQVRAGNCGDLVIDKNGNALAYFADGIYRSTDPTSNSSYVKATGLEAGSRMAVAVSESDPNYAYVIICGSVTINVPQGDVNVASGLRGVYQSKDNGVSFERIIGKENPFFNLLSHINLGQSQGTYDLCIGVHPKEPEHIYMGGISWGEWDPITGPRIVGNNFDHPANPFGIHADKHTITFDSKSDPVIMYIGHDGGISKTTNAALTEYKAINNGYSTTQFYGLAAGDDGRIVGGTQDNSTIYIDGRGSSPLAGEEVLGGDGFQCEISQIDQSIQFVESYNGRFVRQVDGAGSTLIYDKRVNEYFTDPDDPESETDAWQVNDIFNTPMRLWEDTTTDNSRFFYALNRSVWMANKAVTEPNPIWFKVSDVPSAPHQMEVTPDGNHLFIGTLSSNTLLRVDGLNKPTWDTIGQLKVDNYISDSLKTVNIKSNLPGGRSITDIHCDINNPNRVIVTLGNYTTADHVYMTENALDDVPTWKAIDGNLPGFPVYDAEISYENGNHIVLGTEYGIWATQNGNASTPTWAENTDGFPRVAVLQIRQRETWRPSWRSGPILYAGTHGRGIYKSTNLLTSVKDVEETPKTKLIKAFPNPATSFVNLELNVQNRDDLNIQVLDMQGKVVFNEMMEVFGGKENIKLNTAELEVGNYFITIRGQHHQATSRFVKVN